MGALCSGGDARDGEGSATTTCMNNKGWWRRWIRGEGGERREDLSELGYSGNGGSTELSRRRAALLNEKVRQCCMTVNLKRSKEGLKCVA